MTESPTTVVSTRPVTDRAEFRYHLLRAAGERFQTGIGGLDERQRAEVTRLARRTFELECLVLESPEARDLLIPPERVETAVAEVLGRYADETEFRSDLARNGLDPETLRLALRRELIFDGVMQRVAARHVAVTELEERLFYECNQGRFTVPERRTARHLLITVNDDFAENRRASARQRIEQLHEQIHEQIHERLPGPAAGLAERFADLASKHSECPTALEGGRLGEVVSGQLYPSLDAVLFALKSGEISGPVESELGFHLLLCESIQPARSISFSQAQPRIRRLLEERARHNAQNAWISDLRHQTDESFRQTKREGQAA
jgi:peptidyl-prolyl cis-trans isomerase C